MKDELTTIEEHDSALTSAAGFDHYWRIATVFADSSFVPAHFKGKPGDCLIMLEMARQMDEHPLMLMQNCFLVSGTPGWKTQYMISRANQKAGLRSKIKWEVEKLTPDQVQGFPNIKVTAYAIDSHGERIDAWVDTSMAVGEKWTKNAKYKTMFEHMLRYRSAAFLIRQYCPEVMMGMMTESELVDVEQAKPAPSMVADILTAKVVSEELPADTNREQSWPERLEEILELAENSPIGREGLKEYAFAEMGVDPKQLKPEHEAELLAEIARVK